MRKIRSMGDKQIAWTKVYERVCTILLEASAQREIKLSREEVAFVQNMLEVKTITQDDRSRLGKISYRTIENKMWKTYSWWRGPLLPNWEKKLGLTNTKVKKADEEADKIIKEIKKRSAEKYRRKDGHFDYRGAAAAIQEQRAKEAREQMVKAEEEASTPEDDYDRAMAALCT